MGRKKIEENLDRIFQGTILIGNGFKLNQDQALGWISDDIAYRDVLFPFVGGNEVNKNPSYTPSCWVINFWDWPESKASCYDRAFACLTEKVKPERTRRKASGEYQLRRPLPDRWWQHGEKRPALYHAIGRGRHFLKHPKGWKQQKYTFDRVMAISTGVTKYPAFTFLPSAYVYSHKLCVLADERFSMFAILSSDIHGIWAWTQKTSLGGDLYSLVYAHGNIFETFPFPDGFLSGGDAELEYVGEQFFKARQSFMEKCNKGLTKFYNDFHNPKKNDREIVALRNLQREMNEAVCRRYGCEIELGCGFHEVGYLPVGSNTRFTISEDARLEILRLLSKLNRERYNEQLVSRPSTRNRGGEEADEILALDDDDLFAFQGGEE